MNNSITTNFTTAEKVLVDSSSGLFSYINIFSVINLSKSIGTTFLDFSIAGRVHGLPMGDLEASIKIKGPNKKIFLSVDLKGEVTSELPTDISGTFNRAQFTLPGRYTYEFNFNGKTYHNPGNDFFLVQEIE